jgi:Xaa-Pro aminopeptidase
MKRVNLLRSYLSELGIDGFLVTDIKNVRYLSGFTGSAGFLLITKDYPVFITDFRYQEQAKREIKGFKIRIQTNEIADFINKLVVKSKIKKIGFEDHNMSYKMYKELLKKGLKLKALSDTVEKLRMIKAKEEVSAIRTAIRRAENAFKRLQRFIKTGVKEQELAMKLEGFIREEGCKNIPFTVIVASGHVSALPHATPTNRSIKKGDLVLFDWGGESDGYYSDMTRTVVLKGRSLKRQMDIYSIVHEAQNRAIKTIRPGVKAVNIDAAAREFIREKGYKKNFGHGTGHGVGLAVHEKPVISWHSKDIIEEGMIFTVEPGIYIPGFGGVRIEDIVLVRRDGAEILTSLPRNLKVIQG